MKKTYDVVGMHCVSCSTGIRKLVKRLPSVEQVDVELSQSKIHVTFNTDEPQDQDVIDAVKRLGYQAK